MASKNLSARGRGRYFLCTGSIPELAETPPKKKHLDFSPKTLCLASIITQYVTGKRTNTAINHGIDLHGHTRKKDLVDVFHKAGFIISYAGILLL